MPRAPMANAFRARKATRAAPQFGKRPDLANRYSKLLEIVLLHFLPNFLDGKSFGQLLEMLLAAKISKCIQTISY
jgi:hypothetical protein